MGRSGRVMAGLAGVAAVAIATIVVLAVLGSVGLSGPGGTPAATGSAPLAAASAPMSSSASSQPVSSSPSLPAPSTVPPPAGGSTAPPTSTSSPVAPSSSPSAAPGPSEIPAAQLAALLGRIRAKAFVPGVSVAMLWDDGRSWLGASGLRDVAGKLPMTTGTSFALASISKTFTGAVVLELVGEGKLALEQSVAPLLPAFHLDPRITVRMLLDHTSGLPDFFFGKGIDAALQGAPDAAWTPLGAWRYVAAKRPVPGTTWSYSNTNYLLLGELVDAVTGRTLAQQVRTRLLGPLRLGATWYQALEAPRATISTGYRLVATTGGGFRAIAVAPASGVMPFRSVITAAGGAGSMASTALDTARWMQAYARGRVLRPALQRAMLGDLMRTVLRRAAVPYGLGIEETLLAGHPAIGHAGRYLGYRTVVRYLPDLGITIAVLTNEADYDPAKIAAALVGVVAPTPSPAPSPSPSAPFSPSASGAPAMSPAPSGSAGP
jgi:D-alanyl-D-alanine carboxypeptidase